jgi:chemotaxis protein methyltransferase CheR
MELTPIIDLIKQKSGLIFNDERMVTLKAVLQSRMLNKGFITPTDYLYNLSDDLDEYRTLISCLTINETYFFREPAHFKILSEKLIPELVKAQKKLRILCVGCSTGEEPYSVVMVLMEKLGPEIFDFLSVTAVDIDVDVLKTAQRGIFEKYSFRTIKTDFIKKYFVPLNDTQHELSAIIRDKVDFLEYNVMSDSYPENIRNTDIIFYRNVSIYFDKETQKAAFLNLSQILNDNGYLIVSSTETLPHSPYTLSLIEIDKHFLFQKKTEKDVVRKVENILKHNRPLTPVESHVQLKQTDHISVKADNDTGKPLPDQLFSEALTLAEYKNYEAALSGIDRLIQTDVRYIKSYTLKAGIFINLQRLEEAREICKKINEMDEWHMEGHLLCGIIAKQEQNYAEMSECFKRVIYIKPTCWPAHFYMAEHYHKCNMLVKSYNEYEIVMKLLQRGHFEQHGLTLFTLPFQEEQMINLCRHKLNILNKEHRMELV